MAASSTSLCFLEIVIVIILCTRLKFVHIVERSSTTAAAYYEATVLQGKANSAATASSAENSFFFPGITFGIIFPGAGIQASGFTGNQVTFAIDHKSGAIVTGDGSVFIVVGFIAGVGDLS